jgi:cytochrome c biogenesis factor
MLLNYNLFPWLTTIFFFHHLHIIHSKEEFVTYDCFDVYLQPLVKELQ